MHTTITRRGVTQQITLVHSGYGLDEDDKGFVKLPSGFWMSYKSGFYWQEVEQADARQQAA